MQTVFMTLREIALVVAAVLMTAFTASAQYAMTGRVNDSEGEGEPFATLRVYAAGDTTKVLTTGVTEVDGTFTQAMPKAGDYLLVVTAVGKDDCRREVTLTAAQPKVDLGVITLTTSATMLEGVTVTSQRILVRNEIDRVAYDVQADEESKAKTAMDMLRKVPMVSVDGQENIRVKGGSNFVIYKNGHPDAMMSANPKEVLKAIPANMVKKIEVITEPGAKYDAEGVGAILNIVMMESGVVKGVTGSVGAMTDNYGDVNFIGYLTAQYGKFITSVNYGMFHANSHRQHHFEDSEHYYESNGNLLTSATESRGNGTVHFGNIEASYEPDTLNLLTFNFGGHYGGFSLDSYNSTLMSNAGSKLYGFKTDIRMPDYGFFSFNGRFDYQHKTSRKDEALTLSYLLSTTRNTREASNYYRDVEGITLGYDEIGQYNRENFVEQTVQFDWTRPFAKYNKIETGVKYIHRANRSRTTQDYLLEGTMLDPMCTFTRLNHTTQVAAAYLSYTFQKDKWAARAGLRYEYSRLSAKFPLGDHADYHRNLSDWVPSASINYQFDWANSLKLAFATRIARPGISYLNPAIVESVTTRSYGDAHLSSARNYSISLTFMHLGPKFTFNIAPNYDFSSNGITAVRFLGDDGKEVSTYANELSNRQLGLNGFFQWQMFEKTNLMMNAGGDYTWLKSKTLDLKNSGLSGWFFLQLTQQLPWKLRLSANAGAWGGDVDNLYTKDRGMWWHGFSLQRSFLKEDRLTVSLNAQNPFRGKYGGFTSRTIHGDYTGTDRMRWVNRSFAINISYRFGSLNASVKKADKTIENNDVVGGASTNDGTDGNQQQGGRR